MRLMALLQAVLCKHVKRRLLLAWHDVYIRAVMKRFQMARAQGLHWEHVELRALHLWQAHRRRQQRKAAMQAKAHGFARQEDIDVQCMLCCCIWSVGAGAAANSRIMRCFVWVGCCVCLFGKLSVAR